MRGTVISVTWSEGPGVPWVAFTSRISGMNIVYGNRIVDVDGREDCCLSLRRGEYICQISGIYGRSPLIAATLRIMTSEQQEALVGNLEVHGGKQDFLFESVPEHEIVGLVMSEDGAVCGIKQAPLPPSRAPAAQVAVPAYL